MAALPLVVTQLYYLATSAFLSLLSAFPFSDMTTVELPPQHSLMVDNFHIQDIFTVLFWVFVSYLAPAPFLALVAAFTIMLVDTTTDSTAVGKTTAYRI